MRGHRLTAMCILAAVLATAITAESIYFPGIHYWSTGADRDIMAWHTGWDVEANLATDAIDLARYDGITGEGFTIIQRLDYKWDETVPNSPAEYSMFAGQCASYANAIKDYCHIYSIGNEIELWTYGVGPFQYKECFRQVRQAIRSVQPEALVIIGHWCNGANAEQVATLLGPNGFDGFTEHSNGVPGYLGFLDAIGAPPHVGVYITEWGWVRDSNANAQADMTRFLNDVAGWNATHDRQVFSKCWFVYDEMAVWENFSLQISQIDNPAFEYAITHTNPLNSYVTNQIQISNVEVHVNSESQATVTWETDVPATTQAWYSDVGASAGASTPLDPTPRTQHTATVGGLSGYYRHHVVARSTGIRIGDAASGPHVFVTGNSTAIVPYRLADGWSMTSIPLEPADAAAASPEVIFAQQVYAGNPLANNLYRFIPGAGYELYPTDFTVLEPGAGYWLHLGGAVDNTMYGLRIWDPVRVPLAEGWNLVGHPSTNSVTWLTAVSVTDGVTTISVDDAADAGWIIDTAYYFEGGYKALGEQYVADDYRLRQWRAYWVLAMRPGLELVIPTH